MSIRPPIVVGLVALAAVGCKRDPITATDTDTDIDTGTGVDTDTDTADTDTDTDIDTDTDTGAMDAAPQGFAFCSGGGRVEGSGYSATVCLGPMDVGVGQTEGNGYTWQVGPIFILDP